MMPTRPVLKTASLFTLVLVFSMSGALFGQTIAGTWQGTLPDKDSQRVVIKLAQAGDAGPLSGSLTMIDRGASGPPLLSATFVPPELSVTLADISYRGKLNADGKSITGVWTRGNQSYPLTLVLATPETLWTYNGPAPMKPMAAAADPVFEAATVKPSRADDKAWAFGFHGGRFEAKITSVADLIKFAYKVRDRQIDGGPKWMSEDKFDVAAETDTPGQPNGNQQRLMVRKLLADRFGLKVHVVQRDFSVYALTVVKNPPNVTASGPTDQEHGSINVTDRKDGMTAVQFVFYSMPELVDSLMNFIQNRQIVDETGLTGRFNFALLIPANTAYGRQGPDEMDRPTAYFGAVQPLGFKLVPKRSSLDVIVVDQLDRPSAN